MTQDDSRKVPIVRHKYPIYHVRKPMWNGLTFFVYFRCEDCDLPTDFPVIMDYPDYEAVTLSRRVRLIDRAYMYGRRCDECGKLSEASNWSLQNEYGDAIIGPIHVEPHEQPGWAGSRENPIVEER